MLRSTDGHDPEALPYRMKSRLLEVWGEYIERIILYGCRSVGEASPENDFELLVLYDGSFPRRQARRRFRATPWSTSAPWPTCGSSRRASTRRAGMCQDDWWRRWTEAASMSGDPTT